MKRILLLTAVVVLTTLAGCNKKKNEPSGNEDKPKVDWTKSDNFILVELREAASTLGSDIAGLASFEEDGWEVSAEGSYIHLEKTINKVDVVMNCYFNEGKTVFHTTCALDPTVKGNPIEKLSTVKESVEILSSQFTLPTSDVCDFRLMRYKKITSDSYKTLTSFDESLAKIENEEYNYTFIWADQAAPDFDDYTDGLLVLGTMSGLEMSFAKKSDDGYIITLDVTSKKYN